MGTVAGRDIQQWCRQVPVLRDVIACRETFWLNPAAAPAASALSAMDLTARDIADAAARLERFRPFLSRVFAETRKAGGLIESPLTPIAAMQRQLAAHHAIELPGRLLLKCDNLLPISGSVKARGGIYEVLNYAEQLALAHGLLTVEDDYALLAEEKARKLFRNHRIAVGSTGNLGLSIGIMGARLGFRVTVHMSADARCWKKERLRACGVEVLEYDADYSQAVAAGRRQAESDPACHFIDDENSATLFLGYAVAARRLARQLSEQEILVDTDHPLFVYLPCGVGGAPGGITFGLKHLFGDHVHCFFAEPTHSPCMLTGLATGLHNQVAVEDFGLDNRTAADGLAVGRPSGFIGRMLAPVIDGVYTVQDAELYRLLALLADSQTIALEPSAAAGLVGMPRVLEQSAWLAKRRLISHLPTATHIAWATGGSMVPTEEMQRYYQLGREQCKIPHS